MLTRLEVNGFKNLLGVAIEFGPFTCMAGPNGVGKSNVFDAIRFLSLLAEQKIMEAARRVRGGDDDPTNPRDLFFMGNLGGQPHPRMQFAAEMIVPDKVQDPFGNIAKPTKTFLRYELELEYEEPSGSDRYGRIRLAREHLVHINQKDAARHIRWGHDVRMFRRNVVVGTPRAGPFISTTRSENGATVIHTHQDGRSRGRPRPSPARDASATTVGATASVDDPTVFAVKQEMIGWRQFSLEPSAMRRPDKFWEASEASSVTDVGRHIPGTLWHVAEDAVGRTQVWTEVASLLSELVPVEEIRVHPNVASQQYELELREPRGPWFGSRSLSEGTLRFLALATLSVDPRAARVVCMEEPENGVHPQRIPAMLDLLRRIAVDPRRAPSDDNPVRQVIVNTHSPRLVQELERRREEGDLLIAEPTTVRFGELTARTVRLNHRWKSWRVTPANQGVGPGVALDYLQSAIPDAESLLFANHA